MDFKSPPPVHPAGGFFFKTSSDYYSLYHLSKGFSMKPGRLKTIAYWIFTVWVCFGMLSSGMFQLLRVAGTHEFIINNLGYPDYFLTILGVWKILGVAAILAPGLGLLKEWAYAGFFFVAMGVIWSHTASGSPFGEVFPGILLMVLTVASWWLRPPSRRVGGAIA
jgi:hypothetical protein